MEDKVILSVQDLCYRRGHQYVLKNLNWTVHRGENWLIMGQNGCGKTTLLSIFTGFIKQTSGEFCIFDKKLDEENFQSIRKNIGFCSSSVLEKVFHNETALEIVLSGFSGGLCYDDSVTPASIRLVKNYFRYFGILPILNMPFDMLSKGERQCVLLIRAVIGQPSLILLDEPFSGLDMVRRMKAFAIVDRLLRSDIITLFIVTHQPESFLFTIEHTLLMKKGQCDVKGETEKIFNSENLSLTFEEKILVERVDDNFKIRLDEKNIPKCPLSFH